MMFRRWLLALGLCLLPLLCSEGWRLLQGAPFDAPSLLLRVGFFAAVFWVAWLGNVGAWANVLALALAVLAFSVSARANATWLAWVALALWEGWLTALAGWLAANARAWRRWLTYGLLALVAGGVPVTLAQILTRFSDEELFAAVQGSALAGLWLLLVVAWSQLARLLPAPFQQMQSALRFERRWIISGLTLSVMFGSVFTLRVYQQSFYPPQAPPYPGLTQTSPFLCGVTTPSAKTYLGGAVFNSLLAAVEANASKAAPEYGMLALGTGDVDQAQAFRAALLEEAGQRWFTGPAGSVKFGQYEAALRAYYYLRLHAAFPDLFSATDDEFLRRWFADINRRAMTVEWVDWAYALALAERPRGPYENQENGAGLLALLTPAGLAAPELIAANEAYLALHPRGWAARFRNTDDAFVYQPEWINNAFFQAGPTLPDTARLSFDWLMAQALPDGAAPHYDHPAEVSLAGTAYLGAEILNDSEYLWAAGRALEALDRAGEVLRAQPGAERPSESVGTSPTRGSCLIYGDSGLPTQRGPLAPDKIVFRDGWETDSIYLLLNLRFTGWHRYKATNTLTLLYQNGTLASDDLNGAPFAWLPAGRQLFRDKRIPRENLNGLLIEQTGLSRVLYELTGVGSVWAQDPPPYATVENFETGAERDLSRTVIEDWRGWRHARTIYFYHHGPIVVVDEATGPAGVRAGLAWHTVETTQSAAGRFTLRGGDHPAEMLTLSDESGPTQIAPGADAHQSVLYRPSTSGQLRAVTVFLLGDWAGAEARLVTLEGQVTLELARGDRQLGLPMWESR